MTSSHWHVFGITRPLQGRWIVLTWGQQCGALAFSLLLTWKAVEQTGDLIRHDALWHPCNVDCRFTAITWCGCQFLMFVVNLPDFIVCELNYWSTVNIWILIWHFWCYTPPKKRFRSLASVRITRWTWNCKGGNLATKRCRMLKFCKIMCYKLF